jgi:hypothetical protein
MTGKAIEANLAPAEFNRRMEKATEDDPLRRSDFATMLL